MKKYIVRQCAPDCMDLSWYFDGDSFNENAGHFCYTLFCSIMNMGGFMVITRKSGIATKTGQMTF